MGKEYPLFLKNCSAKSSGFLTPEAAAADPLGNAAASVRLMEVADAWAQIEVALGFELRFLRHKGYNIMFAMMCEYFGSCIHPGSIGMKGSARVRRDL